MCECLKLNIQKTKIMASGPTTSWEIDGKTVETVSSQNSRHIQLHQSTWINRLNKLHCSSLYIKTTCLSLWALSSKSIYPPIYSDSPNSSFILHIQTAVNKLINCIGLLFSLLLNFNWFISLENPYRLVILAFFPFLAWRQVQWIRASASHFTNHL